MTKRFAVERIGETLRLLATRRIVAGELLLRIEGDRTRHPSRFSVQVGPEEHILASTDRVEPMLEEPCWRFMNHHCEPSARIQGQEVYALRTLDPSDEITYNYNTTEAEIAEPFLCRCGSPHCMGLIRGFNYLSKMEVENLRPLLADFLLSPLEAGPSPCARPEADRA